MKKVNCLIATATLLTFCSISKASESKIINDYTGSQIPDIHVYSNVENYPNAPTINDYRAYATPVNYNYMGISYGTGSYDVNDKIDVDVNDVSLMLAGMFNKDFLYKFRYYGEYASDDENGFDYEINDSSLDIEVGARFGLSRSTDLVASGNVGYNWISGSVNDYSDHDNGVLVGANLSLHQGLGMNFEAALIANTVYKYDDFENEFGGELTYYITKRFGVGAYYKYKTNDLSDGSYFGGHIRVNFN